MSNSSQTIHDLLLTQVYNIINHEEKDLKLEHCNFNDKLELTILKALQSTHDMQTLLIDSSSFSPSFLIKLMDVLIYSSSQSMRRLIIKSMERFFVQCKEDHLLQRGFSDLPHLDDLSLERNGLVYLPSLYCYFNQLVLQI